MASPPTRPSDPRRPEGAARDLVPDPGADRGGRTLQDLLSELGDEGDDADILERTVTNLQTETERTVVMGSRSEASLSSLDRIPRDERDPLLGATLEGKYRLDAALGVGGTGRVYLARQLSLGRVVAIKVMRPELDPDGEQRFEERFFREASMAGALQHPNVVTVHDFGRTADGLCFIVMELLGGIPLKDLLRGGAMPVERCVALFEQVVRGLRHAHKAGLIHRDMKPGNIQVLPGEEGLDHVKILDFGLVKGESDVAITQHGTFLGTPHYAPPEQVKGEPATPRADLYSVGVMMYRALTGKLPYQGEGAMAIALAHVREPYPPMASRSPEIAVPADVEAVVRRCMEKDPALRYADADALLLELVHLRRRLSPEAPSMAGSKAIPAAAAQVTPLPAVEPPVQPAASASTAPTPPAVRSAVVREAVAAPPPPARKTPWGLIGAALVGLFGVVVMGAWALWPAAPVEVVLEPATVQVEEVAPVEEAPPAPRVVAVHVDSEPPGAEVRRAGVLLGSTPLDIEEKVDPAATEPVLDLELHKAGYAAGSLRLLLTEDAVRGALTLHKEVARPTSKASAGAAEPVAQTVPPPPEKKAEPARPSSSGVVVDGVSMTRAEAVSFVKYLNSATEDQLKTEAGVKPQQIKIIISGRDWTSAEAFGATPQIGEKTVAAVLAASR